MPNVTAEESLDSVMSFATIIVNTSQPKGARDAARTSLMKLLADETAEDRLANFMSFANNVVNANQPREARDSALFALMKMLADKIAYESELARSNPADGFDLKCLFELVRLMESNGIPFTRRENV